MRKHGQTTSVVLYVTQNDFAANFCSSKQFIHYSFLQSFASVQSFYLFFFYQRDRLANLRWFYAFKKTCPSGLSLQTHAQGPEPHMMLDVVNFVAK